MYHYFVKLAVVALFSTVSLAAASAHEMAKGPNGGPVVDVAGHHIEFVPSAGEMTFYLTGETETPIASSGAKVKVIVQDAGKTAQVDLLPVEPNKLSAKLSAPLAKGAKVVVTGALSDGHSLQARFVVP